MNGDTHFEVVLNRDGQDQVYFSDAIRTPLPPEFASEVTLVVVRTEGPAAQEVLAIDPSGTRWSAPSAEGRGANDVVRIAYVSRGAPYWIDVPVSAWTASTSSTSRP